MIKGNELQHGGNLSPLHGEQLSSVDLPLPERVALQFGALALSPGAASIFEEASRDAGYGLVFSRVYDVQTQLQEAGFDVDRTCYHLEQDRLSPVVSLIVKEPSDGQFIVPGLVAPSRFVDDIRDSAAEAPGRKFLTTGNEFEDPSSHRITPFKFEHFPAAAALVFTPGVESPDRPCEVAVLHSPENMERVFVSASRHLQSRGEQYSYLIEDAVLPALQEVLVEASGFQLGAAERPVIDFEHSAVTINERTVELAIFLPTTGGPQRQVCTIGFGPSLEPAIVNMRSEQLSGKEL